MIVRVCLRKKIIRVPRKSYIYIKEMEVNSLRDIHNDNQDVDILWIQKIQ